MCRFKSGLILKNKVVLTPIYNESHSRLLKELNIEDSHMNALTKFVRAELVPPNNDKTVDIKKWKYIVDQDIVPGWYEKDPKKYEAEFRNAVEEWVKEHIVVICGKACIPIKTDGENTYYLLMDKLFNSTFGKNNNNYAESNIRKELASCDFAKQLRKEYGDRLVPISTNLLSMDGFKDYGIVEGDILSIPTFDLYRECRENILNLDFSWWLATPNSTPSGFSSDGVRYVGSDGELSYDWYCDCRAVRPFFILSSSISASEKR